MGGGHHVRADLVLDALDMALAQRRPELVIHHSDKGCQYTSYAFGKRCREAGVVPSMGSTGDAYDNAMAESFFATLEREVIDRRRFTNHPPQLILQNCVDSNGGLGCATQSDAELGT